MRTLIFNGSPRKNGDTEALIDAFAKHLKGEKRIVSCESHVSPCNDCRFCWGHPGCSIDDEMQSIYPFLEGCDTVVLASPIWFSSLSGPLLNLTSRLQTLFAASYFRKETKPTKKKNGVIILAGAEKGTETTPTQTALTIMKLMNVDRQEIHTIYSLDTDHTPAKKDEAALTRCREVAELLNRL